MKLRHLLALLVFSPSVARAETTDKSPNILWIITDDQRPDSLACYNRAVTGKAESPLGFVSSPEIDKLAQEGVLFTRAYCNSPACAPSRGSMITGRYPFRSGIYGFEQTHNAVSTFKPVVPEVMRDSGYSTAVFGKTGYYIFKWGPGLTWNNIGFWDFEVDAKNSLQKNGLTDYFRDKRFVKVDGKSKPVGNEERWFYPDGSVKAYLSGDEDSEGGARPKKQSKDKAVETAGIRDAEKQLKATIEREQEILYSSPEGGHIIGGESTQPAEKTLDGWTVAELKRFLDNSGNNYETAYGLKTRGPSPEKPAFINLGFHFPHTPVLPPQKFRELYAGKQYKIPVFSSEELKSLPRQLQILHEKNSFDHLKPPQKQQAIRDYYAFCTFGDSLVGEAVEKFKNFSKKQNREYLIIYVCGDHGWHLGEQGIEAKFGPYDTSNHDAVIVVSSDKTAFPPGIVNNDFIEFVDFAPTIYTAAGLDVTKPEYAHLDGRPLQNVVSRTAIKLDYVLGEMNHVYGPRAYIRSDNFAFSMRTREKNGKPGDKYGQAPGENIRWALDASPSEVEIAFFDLRSDPMERHNLASDDRYEQLVDFFRQKLGNIVLGDGRLEVDWKKENSFHISDFALDADDKKLEIPAEIIPHP